MALKRLAYASVGSDPELFLQQGGKIVGSERLIPEVGFTDSYNKVVRDGVQMELHPRPTYDMMSNLNSMRAIFKLLKDKLATVKGMEVCYSGVIEVDKDELNSLSESSRILGCQPSQNYYGIKPIEVDPIKYRKRSAGGHIHLGIQQGITYDAHAGDLMGERTRVVPILDVLLGNTSVFLDRDPMQAERRRLYGRAGEFRTPSHGIEYRTLSNFWLHSPILAEFVMWMAKECISVLYTTVVGQQDLERKLLSKVDFKSMIKGIQKNDPKIAAETWRVARLFISNYFDAYSPIPPELLPNFERFIEGLKKYFPKSPEENWDGKGSLAWTAFLKGV